MAVGSASRNAGETAARLLAASPRVRANTVLVAQGAESLTSFPDIGHNAVLAVGGPSLRLRATRAMRKRLCDSHPDVLVAVGAEAARVALPAALRAGVRSALWEDPDDRHRTPLDLLLRHSIDGVVPLVPGPVDPQTRERVVSHLSTLACRPGAGLAEGPAISVIVTVLQEREAIDGLLATVTSQLGAEDELIVVDGGSTDGTAERVQEDDDARVRLHSAPGSNISQGRNIGISTARNSIVACTDAGCAPAPGWLDAFRSAFAESAGQPGLVAGTYRVRARTPLEEAQVAACHPDPDEARRPDALVKLYGRLFGRVFNPTRPQARSLAMSKEACLAVGGFPEHLVLAEDVAFGLAMARSGRPCNLATEAEVEWDPRPSLASTARMYHSYGLWDGRSRDPSLVARNLVRALAYVAAPALVLRSRRLGVPLVTAGATAYLSLPLRRAWRRPRRWSVLARLPLPLLVMDLAKASGCLKGVLELRGQRAPADH